MLVHLHVKNLALIEEIEVEFGPGLNILTGETGAGKSILLGSIQLILGGKTSRGMIRENASYGLVELLFQVENTKAKQALESMDIYPQDGQVLLSRKIMEGRSISKINGEACTVSQMKAAAACLIDIHGQHEHQSLLYPDKQLEILDVYGKEKIQPVKEKVEKAYKEYRKCEKELQAFNMDEEQRNRETAFLEFEVQEIEKAALKEGEDEELEKSYRKLSNGRKIVDALQAVRGFTGYEGSSAGDLVGEALRELSRVSEYDEELAGLESSLGEVDSLLNDFNRELSSYMEDMVFDQETFDQTERRLDQINGLKAKYGQSIGKILEYQKQQMEKLEKIQQYDQLYQEAKEKLCQCEKVLQKNGDELSKIRKEYSRQLEAKVIQGLQDLNFANVDFAISFKQARSCTAAGYDVIEYEISTNPGESRKPLGKIVSGGELSRIMLALKSVAAQADGVDTLIFDEIDTGISGETANRVAKKMAVISKDHQVIAITHLPQIAAMADSHYFIRKQTDQKNTQTMIRKLNESESLKEISRMISGDQWSETSMEHAKEMKSLADQTKLY